MHHSPKVEVRGQFVGLGFLLLCGSKGWNSCLRQPWWRVPLSPKPSRWSPISTTSGGGSSRSHFVYLGISKLAVFGILQRPGPILSSQGPRIQPVLPHFAIRGQCSRECPGRRGRRRGCLAPGEWEEVSRSVCTRSISVARYFTGHKWRVLF